MKELEPDIFHDESVRKTIRDPEKSYQERLQADTPSAVPSFDEHLHLELMRKRLDPTGKESDLKIVVSDAPENVQLRRLREDSKKLKNMNLQERERLKISLLEAEGYDTVKGFERERGVAEGVQSLAINIRSLEFMIGTKRGEHDSIIGKLAAKALEKNLDVFPEDMPAGAQGLENEILYGAIHQNVPGFSVPLVRFKLDKEKQIFSNLYISNYETITAEQIQTIHQFLITNLHMLPMDKFCNPI